MGKAALIVNQKDGREQTILRRNASQKRGTRRERKRKPTKKEQRRTAMTRMKTRSTTWQQ